jgi:hypothetical protein
MGSRGRKSADSLAVVATFESGKPPPPVDMPEPQANVWRAVVATEDQQHFRTRALQLMLTDYCRHVVMDDRLSAMADAFKDEWVKVDGGLERLERILKMRDKEARGAADKATKLRLTNQSRYTPHGAAVAARGTSMERYPWESEAQYRARIGDDRVAEA